ncbi:MAG: hypothetical protein HC880_15140 [Bacteroidia bacterium]|nr:hypothetical protein [Bacteroidia bacterium]
MNIYYGYSIVSTLGFFYTLYGTLQHLGIRGFISNIIRFETNNIAMAIYEDYAIGFYSLRYVLVISFGWALFRVLIHKRVSLVDLLNIFLFLFYIAFFGRRLQLICSIFVFIGLLGTQRELPRHFNVRKVLMVGVFIFGMLIIATTLRNYNSYEELGYSSPIWVTLANISSYLGAPFQVSLGIGNNFSDALRGVPYQELTDIHYTLTANSAFTSMIELYGITGFVYMMVIIFGFGLLAGWLHANRSNYLFTGYPILMYAFAELWRINLFSTGIFFTLLITAVFIPFIYTLLITLIKNQVPNPNL